MSEHGESGEGVAFSQLRPIEFVKLPGQVLVDFLPGDTVGIHYAVDGSLQQPDGLEGFMAAELGPEELPWAEGKLYAEEAEVVRQWRDGFIDKLGFLKTLGDFIEPGSDVTVPPDDLSWLVSNATAVYLELVELTAQFNDWSEADLVEAKARVMAELTMPNKGKAWVWWNNRAVEYTDRKVKRLNEVLRQRVA